MTDLELTELKIIGNKQIYDNCLFTFYLRKVKHFNRDKPHWKIALGRDSLVALTGENEHADFCDTEQHAKFDTHEEALEFFKQTNVYKRHFSTI